MRMMARPMALLLEERESGAMYVPAIADSARPKEVLATGDNLSAKWAELVAAANAAFAARYEYRPIEQNSNTFVATLLENVGLPQPSRQIFPGSGILGQFDTPAY